MYMQSWVTHQHRAGYGILSMPRFAASLNPRGKEHTSTFVYLCAYIINMCSMIHVCKRACRIPKHSAAERDTHPSSAHSPREARLPCWAALGLAPFGNSLARDTRQHCPGPDDAAAPPCVPRSKKATPDPHSGAPPCVPRSKKATPDPHSGTSWRSPRRLAHVICRL